MATTKFLKEMNNTVNCRVQWTDAMVKSLLTEMKTRIETVAGPLSTQMWNNIAASVNTYGYNLSSDNCYIKWTSMKKKYKMMKDARNQSGAAKASWEYFDIMDDALQKNPEIQPLSLASNTHGFRIYENSSNTLNNEENDLRVKSINTLNDRPKRKRKSALTDWMEELKKQKERHHKENYNQREHLLTLLEKHLKKYIKENYMKKNYLKC